MYLLILLYLSDFYADEVISTQLLLIYLEVLRTNNNNNELRVRGLWIITMILIRLECSEFERGSD